MRGLSFAATPMLILGLSAAAQADTIGVTAGTLTLNRTFGELHIEGPRGFRLDSFISDSALLGTVLVPGETLVVDMRNMTVGPSFSIDGEAFQLHPISGPITGAVSFVASVVAPPFSDAEPVSVFAPFTFTGVISGGPDARFPLHLLGQGRMQVEFVSNPFIPVGEPPRAVLQ